MLFSAKTTLIVFLQEGSLEFITTESGRAETFAFPKKYIRELQVLDSAKLKQQIIDFLIQANFQKQHCLLVLGDDVIAKKSVPLKEKNLLEKEAEGFFVQLPIPGDDLAQKTLANKESVYLIAVNRQIYEVVNDAFEAVGWKIDSIVPLLLFGATEQKITFEDATEILKSKSLIETGDFLKEFPVRKTVVHVTVPAEKEEDVQVSETSKEEVVEVKEKKGRPTRLSRETAAAAEKVQPTEPEEPAQAKTAKVTDDAATSPVKNVSIEEENQSWFQPKYIILGLIILFLAGLLGGLVQFHWFAGYLSKMGSSSPTPVPTKAPTPTPTPTVAATKKEDLKVQIQNGTGTAGQAKTVSNLLIKLGLTQANITTGNADTTDHTDTEITFAPTVAQSDQDAIVNALKQNFKNVVVHQGPSSSSSDVVIVTGQSS